MCIFNLFSYILYFPEYNNIYDFSELLDINFKNFVKVNSHKSKEIYKDCKDITEIILNDDYIEIIKCQFELEEDAYHYLALVAQMIRMSNRFKIITRDNDMMYFKYCNCEGITEGLCYI